MGNNDDFNILVTKKYNLTVRSLNQLMDKIYEDTGISVICYETNEGYVFKDEKYLIPIGDITFDFYRGEYGRVSLYPGGIDEVRIREGKEKEMREKARYDRAMKRAEQQRKRKFALQVGKVVAVGAALTITAVGVLTSLGVINKPFSPKANPVDTNVVAVQDEQKLNTLDSANDIILFEWMNYAMGQVTDLCNSSEYEYFQTLRDEVYTNYYAPAMSSYYNYLDCVDAGLPLSPEYGDKDYVGDAHKAWRSSVKYFADFLRDSQYLSNITFASSPLANAVVTDTNGNVLSSSDVRTGELVSSTGETVTVNSEGYIVNVKINDLENSPYSLDNLPEDVKIINGEVYVPSSHMYQDYGTMTKSN